MAKPTARTLFETVFPGLLARVEGLGGTFLPPEHKAYPGFKFARDDVTLVMAEMGIRCLTKTKSGRAVVVQIAVRMKRERDEWVNQYASMHCGPTPDDMSLVFFRIDNAPPDGKHCHIRGHGEKPEKGGHIPFENVVPPPSLDPYEFLNLVYRFIETDQLPLKVRP